VLFANQIHVFYLLESTACPGSPALGRRCRKDGKLRRDLSTNDIDFIIWHPDMGGDSFLVVRRGVCAPLCRGNRVPQLRGVA
jgi:hypothetical protein